MTMYLTPYSRVADDLLRDGQLGLLITPQSHRPAQYDVADFDYWAADNGCFTLGDRFQLDQYLRWLDSFTVEAKRQAIFATAPDVVGDWAATLERSQPTFELIRTAGFPVAVVLQDGATPATVPWSDVDAVFVGGSTDWKLSGQAAELMAAADELDKWVHVGRVNSTRRIVATAEMGAHSVDGTLLIFGPNQNLPRLYRGITAAIDKAGDVILPADWNRYAA
jgi:hypothetical protein